MALIFESQIIDKFSFKEENSSTPTYSYTEETFKGVVLEKLRLALEQITRQNAADKMKVQYLRILNYFQVFFWNIYLFVSLVKKNYYYYYFCLCFFYSSLFIVWQSGCFLEICELINGDKLILSHWSQIIQVIFRRFMIFDISKFISCNFSSLVKV